MSNRVLSDVPTGIIDQEETFGPVRSFHSSSTWSC